MSKIIKGLDPIDKEIGYLLTHHFAKFSTANSETQLATCLLTAISDFRLFYDERLKHEIGKEATDGK